MSKKPPTLPPDVKSEVAKLPEVVRTVIAQRMRDAKLPEVYSALVEQIKACEDLLSLDYFGDAAEALASYAKIHKDGALQRQAEKLNRWAAWACGRAAEKLQPTPLSAGGNGQRAGAAALLRERGISAGRATQLVAIGRLSADEMQTALTSSSHVPGITRLSRRAVGRGMTGRPRLYSDSAAPIIGGYAIGGGSGNLKLHAEFCRRMDANSARQFTAPEAARARELLQVIQEWHDAFEQHLPKEKAGPR